MVNGRGTTSLRWPFSAAATFVGIMWIAYGWSIWAAEGIDRRSGGMWIGSLTGIGYYITGSLYTPAVALDGEWERLIASIFLHGGFLHILMNSAAILQLGRLLELFTTPGRCWLTLLVSGLFGSLATWGWAEVTGAPNNAIGASGAGCGLGAALIVLSRGIPALTEFRKQMVTWVVVMLAMGFIPMISGTGHAGGAAGGAVAGLLISRRGSMRLARDGYARALGLLAVVLTVLFAAGLAVNVSRAPERKAAVAQIDAAVSDIHAWIDSGNVPDVGPWIAQMEAARLPAPLDPERKALISLVQWLQSQDGGRIGPATAESARAALEQIRGG